MTGFTRTAAILSAIILGALIPQAHVFAGAIRWLVILMLFLVFLQTKFSTKAIHGSHLILLATNVLLGFGSLGLGWLIGGRDVGLAAFFCGIAPTAIAAPVIISFLGGRVEYVVASFVLTNVSVAAMLPLLLPLVLGRATPQVFADVAGSVGIVVFGPMIVAAIVRALHPAAHAWPARLRNVSFSMWVTSMFLITANASDFVRQHAETPHLTLFKIAAVSLAACIASFGLGRIIGGREFTREASQALGQKNTTFTIYLALTYATPLVALGPTCYVIWHNLWNSWQLHRAARAAAPRL